MKKSEKSAIAVAAFFGIAGCAVAPSAMKYSLSSLGEVEPGTLRLFVDAAPNSPATFALISGSAMHNGRSQSGGNPEIIFQRDNGNSRVALFAAPRTPSDLKIREAVSSWAESFSTALSEQSQAVFAPDMPALYLKIFMAPTGATIDRLYSSPLSRTEVDIQFEIPASLLNGSPSFSEASGIIGHEIYHALTFSLAKDRIEKSRNAPLPPLERALGEAAAAIFGNCVSITATGVAMQNDRISINGRTGSVLTDLELKGMLERDIEKVTGRDVPYIGKAIGNTIWSSMISPKRFIENTDSAAEPLLALCRPETLGDPMSLLPILGKIAGDNLDAPPLE